MAGKHKPGETLRDAVSALQRLADAFAQRRAQLAQFAGLSEAQWRVLDQIAEQDFMPSLFARRRARSAAAVSKLIRQLLDLGLIDVGIAEADARQRTYTLTAAGRAVMEAVRKGRERALARIWADFEPAALRRFTDFAAQLADRMEAHAREEARRGPTRRGPETKTARRGGPVRST